MHVYPRKSFFRHFMVALKKNFSNIFSKLVSLKILNLQKKKLDSGGYTLHKKLTLKGFKLWPEFIFSSNLLTKNLMKIKFSKNTLPLLSDFMLFFHVPL